uniref:Uncharacterized protein n=1 Tax=Arundo donax TaxID=35708 RepID=A0A0A9ETT8_ARUDO
MRFGEPQQALSYYAPKLLFS